MKKLYIKFSNDQALASEDKKTWLPVLNPELINDLESQYDSAPAFRDLRKGKEYEWPGSYRLLCTEKTATSTKYNPEGICYKLSLPENTIKEKEANAPTESKEKEQAYCCLKCRTTNFTQTCHDIFCPIRVRPESEISRDDLLKEVKELDKVLERDGYKDWCYQRLTVSKVLKQLADLRAERDKLQYKLDKMTGVKLDTIIEQGNELMKWAELKAENERLKSAVHNQAEAFQDMMKGAFTAELERRKPSEEEKRFASLEYAKKMSAAPDKESPEWIMTDFENGVNWLLSHLTKDK